MILHYRKFFIAELFCINLQTVAYVNIFNFLASVKEIMGLF